MAPAVCNCYWRGSEDEDRRLRWRYTSVPYLYSEIVLVIGILQGWRVSIGGLTLPC